MLDMEGGRIMIEDRKYDNILEILNDDFSEICYEIKKSAKQESKYRDLLYMKEIFLDDFPVIKTMESLKPFEIKNEETYILKEYYELNENIKNELMKEAYYRGMKDTILLLCRSHLFKEN